MMTCEQYWHVFEQTITLLGVFYAGGFVGFIVCKAFKYEMNDE